MTSHTTVPWTWLEGSEVITRQWDGKSWPIASVGTCRLGWHENQNCANREAGANAAHIVRCVNSHDELLEALQTLISLYDDMVCQSSMDVICQSPAHILAARAAIAKATS